MNNRFLLIMLLSTQCCIAQPVINSFSPKAAPAGAIVNITGSGFGATSISNIVRFGAERANVLSASTTALTVVVPTGATYEPITNTVNGLTAYTSTPFMPTFAGADVPFHAASFATPVTFYTGSNSNPQNLRLCDFDGDGKTDVAVACLIANKLSVLRNTSTIGTVAFANAVRLSTDSFPVSVDVGDLDGDGLPDIAVGNINRTDRYASNTAISLYRNTSANGNISFTAEHNYKYPDGCFAVAIRDLDADGKPDIVVTIAVEGGFMVYKNTSTPGLLSFSTPLHFPGLPGSRSIGIADIDGDGKPDIATASDISASASVYRNTSVAGVISFAPRQDYAAGYFSEFVVLGDIDGDAKPDMAVANTGAQTLSLYLNTSSVGNISFAAKTDVATAYQPDCIALSDLNGDGRPDIAVTNYDISGTVSVFSNTSSAGKLSFAAMVNYNTGNSPPFVTCGDIDGDGKSDIVVSNNLSHNLVVLRNNIANLPLSLHLLTFTATLQRETGVGGRKLVNLQWTAENELNFDRYEVERSVNGREFYQIDNRQLTIDNWSGNVHHYSYADDISRLASHASWLYYRLKMLDKDGSFTYSPVRVIKNSGSFTVSVYPNPIEAQMRVEIVSEKKVTLQVQVVSQEGKIMLSTEWKVSEGSVVKTINTTALKSGSFFIKITSADKEQRVVKFEKM